MVTTLDLPAELKILAEQAASARGLSLEEFVRDVLEGALGVAGEADPLFSDEAVYVGAAPTDLSANPDRYLYGEES